jgi:spore maturation protein CgeB
MRLVILKFAYANYLRQFYERNPELRTSSYDQQKAALDHDAFWWGDAWTHALRPLGYDVTEIVMNAAPMQRAWARENGLEAQRVALLDVVEHQLRRLRPDVLFAQSFGALSLASLRGLRERCPSVRAVVGWCGAPTDGARTMGACDAIVSCVPEMAEALNAAGHRCFHMNHAFDPRAMDRVGPPPADLIDLSFVGSVLDQSQHGERRRVLEAIGRETKLQVFTELPAQPPLVKAGWVLGAKAAYLAARGLARMRVPTPVVYGLPLVGRATSWRSLPRYVRNPVPRADLHDAVYGIRMLRTFQGSRLTLNAHSTVSPRSASNIRMFEAAGAGTCLLTDWKQNLGELFEPDREVVAYRSPEDAVEKVRWLLDHPVEREAISVAGQRRVAREHTFAHRAPILDGIIKGELARA